MLARLLENEPLPFHQKAGFLPLKQALLDWDELQREGLKSQGTKQSTLLTSLATNAVELGIHAAPGARRRRVLYSFPCILLATCN